MQQSHEDLKDSAASGLELYALCRKMEAIFQLQFLKILGFSESEITTIVGNFRSLKDKLSDT
jgi:hypothetical protein